MIRQLRFISAIVFLLLSLTVTICSAFFLLQEASYQILTRQIRELNHNENSYTAYTLNKDLIFYEEMFSLYGNSAYLNKLSSLYIKLSTSKKIDAQLSVVYKKRAVELLESAIIKSPLEGHLWLKLAFLYRTLGYPTPRIVKVLFTAHKVAPFSPYYVIPRIKIYIDYWDFISPQMQRDTVVIIARMLDADFYGLLAGLSSHKYSDFIVALDLYKENPEKDALLKNMIDWHKKTGVIK